MATATTPFSAPGKKHATTDFHGACIIDESGKEIPITEQMLQQTFQALIRAWEQCRKTRPL